MTELVEIKKENIKRVYEIISIEEELNIISPDVLKKAIYFKDGSVFIGNDKVVPKISKNGSIYFMLRGEIYIKTYSIKKAVLKMLIENKFTYVKDIAELPKFNVKLLKSDTGKEYLCWFNNQDEPVMIYTKESGMLKLEKQLTDVEYAVLKEELLYMHHIEPDVVFNDEKDEIYGDKPEDFISRESELKELLQIVLDIRGSGRRLFPEEIELLREIQSEIDILI